MCVQDSAGDEQAREKRKLEGATQAKFGIKNAVLGFVFGVSSASLPSPGMHPSLLHVRHSLSLL